MAPAPYPRHQRVAKRIAWELDRNMDCKKCEAYLSPVDWKIDDATVVQPDVAVFCEETARQYFTQTPPLVVEVLSKATAHKDVTIKFDLYEKTGVTYYIIVEPESHVSEVFVLENRKYRLLEKIEEKQKIRFDLGECATAIDFGTLWE